MVLITCIGKLKKEQKVAKVLKMISKKNPSEDNRFCLGLGREWGLRAGDLAGVQAGPQDGQLYRPRDQVHGKGSTVLFSILYRLYVLFQRSLVEIDQLGPVHPSY